MTISNKVATSTTTYHTGNVGGGGGGAGGFGYVPPNWTGTAVWPGAASTYGLPPTPDMDVSPAGKVTVLNPLIRWLNNEQYLCICSVDGKTLVVKFELRESKVTKMFSKPFVIDSFEIFTEFLDGKVSFWAMDKDKRKIESDNLDAVVGGVLL